VVLDIGRVDRTLRFLQELRRRNVVKVAIAYVVTAWLVLQVADVVLNNISAPDWVFKVLLLFLALGFPFAVILAWAFELTPEGLRRETAGAESSRPDTPSHYGNILLFTVVVAALVYFGWTRHGWNEADTPSTGEIRSIVVLPLQNLMNDPEQAYFVEGLHEALITELSKVESLRVISRTSSMHFKDSDKPVPEIGRELGVDAVVEGSVLRAGNTVRVTTQLIEAATDRHLWADNFDRELTDILALYSDVTREIVNQIRVKVTTDEVASLASSTPVNPRVYELYLKGRHLCGNWSPQEMQQGVELFSQAIDLDPGYAPAYAQLAMCLQDSAFFEYVNPLAIDARAREAAQTAVRLDDQSAEAHLSLGGVNYYLGFDPVAAEPDYFKALQLNPNSIDVLLRISWFLAESGRFAEAIGPTRRALELDPLSTTVINAMGQVHYLSRDFDQAIEAYAKALELDRSDPSLHYYLAGAYEERGEYEKAIALYQSAIERSDGAGLYRSALGHAYGRAGMRHEAEAILAGLEREENPSPYDLAIAYLGLGQHERAIDWLEKAYDARNGHMVYLKEGPRFDPLRDRQRFIDLLARFGWQ